MPRRGFILSLAIAVVVLGSWVFWRLLDLTTPVLPPTAPVVARAPVENRVAALPEVLTAGPSEADLARVTDWLARFESAGARSQEALLKFASAAALQRFLNDGAAGLQVVAHLPALMTLRVRYGDRADLERELLRHTREYADAAANVLMQLPVPFPQVDRVASGHVPVGDRLREFLGITTDQAQWGRGITIAIIDTGVAPDQTFGSSRLRSLDLGYGLTGTAAGDGHATAVASLAGGATPDAPGVAPAAGLLSLRVTDENGVSDVFSVAQAIVTAVDQGVQIANISLGAYETGRVLTEAIDYAVARGVVLVAAAGNDQAAQLVWPAADPRVVSVGAVDAQGNQVIFSNAGPQLQFTAPGFGVLSAWSHGERVWFDGTSASAPIVAGALAALMTQNAGMTAAQARDTLAHYVSDGGPAGADPDYGAGIVNLGWALGRQDLARTDTAVSSHYYDATTDTVQVVVQNRSAHGVGGLVLYIDADSGRSERAIPWLDGGGTRTITIPAQLSVLPTDQNRVFRTALRNAAGIVDADLTNNIRASTLAGRSGP